MHNETIAVVVMLIASATYALSFVLQHKGTQQVVRLRAQPDTSDVKLYGNKIWLLGVVCFSVSFWLHLAALKFGSVAVVQPLIVTELIFIPPFSALISHAKVSAKDWVAIVAVAAGLAGYLITADPSSGTHTPTTMQWIIVIVGFSVAIAALVLVGSRLGLVARAAMCGTAAGLVGALMSVAANGAFDAPSSSITSMLTNPLAYVTGISAVATIGLSALAFRSGPITVSSPAMIGVNPIVALLVSMWIFQVEIHHTALDLVIILICVAVVAAGIVYLTQNEQVDESIEDSVSIAD